MKRIFVFILAAFCLVASISGETVIKEMDGKVQLKPFKRGWIDASVGMTVEKDTIISTGFKSTALLDFDGTSEVRVNQLTRLTLDEFLQQEGLAQTSLFLRVGGIQADVKTTEGLKQDFQVKSPYSTASVRGTKFSLLQGGKVLAVAEGSVALGPPDPKRNEEEKQREKEEKAEEDKKKDAEGDDAEGDDA